VANQLWRCGRCDRSIDRDHNPPDEWGIRGGWGYLCDVCCEWFDEENPEHPDGPQGGGHDDK
jgi:hypothetical protein